MGKWLLSEFSDAWPYHCFKNWLRPHDLLVEYVADDGARKLVCFNCGLAFGETSNGRLVWDSKLDAAIIAYNKTRK